MESSVREVAKDLTEKIAQELTSWFNACPFLWTHDTYYPSKMRNRTIFTPEELATAEYIVATFPTTTRICEIGIGFGQLSLLLAAQGFTVTGVEGADWRFDGSKHLRDHFNFPNYTVLKGMYPQTKPAESDLVVGMNIVNSFWQNWQSDNKRQEVLSGKQAIFDVGLWFKIAENPEEQKQIVQEVEKLGFAATPVLNSVYHFRPNNI